MPVMTRKGVEGGIMENSEAMSLLTEVHKSQNYLSQQFDDFNKRTQLLENENKVLKKELSSLQMRLSAVEADYNDLQHQLYEKHIYVSGIPQTQNECINKIILDIAAVNKIEIKSENIVNCKRLPLRKTNKDKPLQHPQIMVEFDRVSIKNELLLKQKSNGPILQSQLKISSNNNKIYLNEFLSNYNKKLLHETQKLKTKHGIKFVWAKFGYIFLRQDETSKIIKIRSIDHLADIEKQF